MFILLSLVATWALIGGCATPSTLDVHSATECDGASNGGSAMIQKPASGAKLPLLSADSQGAAQKDAQTSKRNNYAYVTMWFFPEDKNPNIRSSAKQGSLLQQGNQTGSLGHPEKVSLFQKNQRQRAGYKAQASPKGIAEIARMLRDVGAKYPLLVLTNREDYFANGYYAKDYFEGDASVLQNIVFQGIYEWSFGDLCTHSYWHITFQKLQIFRATQYDKLLWLDADITMRSNVDDVFDLDLDDGNRVWTQADHWGCNGIDYTPMCSGMMLIKPDLKAFDWCADELLSRNDCPAGDQNIIGDYFQRDNRTIHHFPNSTVIFAQCLNKTNPANLGHEDHFDARVVHFAR